MANLVLEGGGVKCAYQVGALLALEQKGYTFSSISGASFGALNGALYIEGGTSRLLDFYFHINAKDIYLDDYVVDAVENFKGNDGDLAPFLFNLLKTKADYISSREKVSDNYHAYVKTAVNGEAIKNSSIEFECTTLEIRDSKLVLGMIAIAYFKDRSILNALYQNGVIKGHNINLKEIDTKYIPDYIAASANYPFFTPLLVEDKEYLDGGIYDNLPYKKYINSKEKTFIIRTHVEPLDSFDYGNDNLILITPKTNLGSSLKFTKSNIEKLIKQGYEETKEFLENM